MCVPSLLSVQLYKKMGFSNARDALHQRREDNSYWVHVVNIKAKW